MAEPQQRVKKKRRRTTGTAGLPDPTGEATLLDVPSYAQADKPKKLRGAAAEDALRAELEPMAPDERPAQLWISMAVAIVCSLSFALSAIFESDKIKPFVAVGFALLLAAIAVGVYQKQYVALLGVQIMLMITCIYTFFALWQPANVWAGVLAASLMVLSGWLFYKNIRPLARLGIPKAPETS